MSAGVRMIAASSVVSCLLVLAACNSTPPPATAAPAVVSPEPPGPGVVGSAIGRDLDAADKDKAQQEAAPARPDAVNAALRSSS